MRERIKEIWNHLESNTSTIAGLFKQRYSDTCKCDAFLGVKYPENFRMLILKVPFAVGKDFNFKYEFRCLRFEKVYDHDDSNLLLLNLVLSDRIFKDVFDSLVIDILGNIINESDIKVILKKYTNRLEKWRNLFERYNPEGLTPEEQRGLFGELYFLRKFLQANTNCSDVVNTWVGAEKQVRDFQSGTWAVEVKTTSGNNHQKVYISSERQLDITNLESLYLYHISLEQMQNSGETLNDIVDSVIEILRTDIQALNKFKGKIYEAGYFELQRDLYNTTGYIIRGDIFYKVENDFPRIQEHEIRQGVGDVKYSVILSGCSNYIKEHKTVFENLNLI